MKCSVLGEPITEIFCLGLGGKGGGLLSSSSSSFVTLASSSLLYNFSSPACSSRPALSTECKSLLSSPLVLPLTAAASSGWSRTETERPEFRPWNLAQPAAALAASLLGELGSAPVTVMFSLSSPLVSSSLFGPSLSASTPSLFQMLEAALSTSLFHRLGVILFSPSSSLLGSCILNSLSRRLTRSDLL